MFMCNFSSEMTTFFIINNSHNYQALARWDHGSYDEIYHPFETSNFILFADIITDLITAVSLKQVSLALTNIL